MLFLKQNRLPIFDRTWWEKQDVYNKWLLLTTRGFQQVEITWNHVLFQNYLLKVWDLLLVFLLWASSIEAAVSSNSDLKMASATEFFTDSESFS